MVEASLVPRFLFFLANAAALIAVTEPGFALDDDDIVLLRFPLSKMIFLLPAGVNDASLLDNGVVLLLLNCCFVKIFIIIIMTLLSFYYYYYYLIIALLSFFFI